MGLLDRLKALWGSDRRKKRPSAPSAEDRPARATTKREEGGEPPSRLASAKLVNLGVDFGTSTSKVFVNDVVAERIYVCAHDPVEDAFGPFCWPTTVAWDGGRLYFGAVAEQHDGALAVRSFKPCVACVPGQLREKCRESSRYCAFTWSTEGLPVLRTGQKNPEFTPSEIATLYLANLIGYVAHALGSVPAFKGGIERSVNSAAPLDMFQQPEAKGAFEMTLFRANLLAGRVGQGLDAGQAREMLDDVARHLLPGQGLRPTFVIPETHAAMIGYFMLPGAESGRYVTVDVGAATTDVAVFLFEPEPNRRVWYYAAASTLVGGDDIDLALTRLLGSDPAIDAALLASARVAKHGLQDDGIALAGRHLAYQSVLQAVGPVADRMFTHYRRTWYLGYQKEMRADRWQVLKFLLLGGGGQFPPISKSFERNPTDDLGNIVHSVQPLSVALPEGIGILGDAKGKTVSDYTSVLMVAYGLSYHRGQQPPFCEPWKVGPLPPRPRVPPSPLIDDGVIWG